LRLKTSWQQSAARAHATSAKSNKILSLHSGLAVLARAASSYQFFPRERNTPFLPRQPAPSSSCSQSHRASTTQGLRAGRSTPPPPRSGRPIRILPNPPDPFATSTERIPQVSLRLRTVREFRHAFEALGFGASVTSLEDTVADLACHCAVSDWLHLSNVICI
jgi:hypothetical protein